MEEIVTKSPNRFEREKGGQRASGRSSSVGGKQRPKSGQTESKERGREVAFKLCHQDGDGRGEGPSAWQLPAGDPEGM